ncbi:unnamed protein product, partial [Discosporangium mesarthrocarpum]
WVAGRLSDLVKRVVAQCQACLYNVAVVECADHHCAPTATVATVSERASMVPAPAPAPVPASTGAAPLTAGEAARMYETWERCFHRLRRPRLLRLLEAVYSTPVFCCPPPTRLSAMVNLHLFRDYHRGPPAAAQQVPRGLGATGVGA